MSRTAILVTILPLLVLGGCNSDTTHQNADIDIGADDVTWFDFMPGAQPRIEGLEAVRNYMAPLAGQIPPHTYDIVNPKVQVYGNTAILTFHWKATSVYHWKNGKWSMVHAHWSTVQGA